MKRNKNSKEFPWQEKNKKVYLKKLTGKGAGHNEGGHYETFNRSDGFICRRN